MNINLLLKLIVEKFKFIIKWITLNTVYNVSIYNLSITEISLDELQKKECGVKCPILTNFYGMNGALISKLDF